jgi:hypothetical protein
MMRRDSSATGIISDGVIVPSEAEVQRSNASAMTMAPESTSTMAWKARLKSLLFKGLA